MEFSLWATCCAPARIWLAVIFKMANNKVDLGQIRSEEIVHCTFIKIPVG